MINALLNGPRRRKSAGGTGCLFFLPLYNPFATFPTAKYAAFDKNEDSNGCTGEQECQNIQAVVLVPGEMVSSWSQVLCSFVTHDEFNPEDSSVQRRNWLVVMYL